MSTERLETMRREAQERLGLDSELGPYIEDDLLHVLTPWGGYEVSHPGGFYTLEYDTNAKKNGKFSVKDIGPTTWILLITYSQRQGRRIYRLEVVHGGKPDLESLQVALDNLK